MAQKIIETLDVYFSLTKILSEAGTKKYLLVCDSSFPYLCIKEDIERLNFPRAVFSEFTPNPQYEEVCAGVDFFRSEDCDTIVAVGGGSAIDVAKCIKLFAKMDPNVNYLKQEFCDTNIPLIAIPTTAGTGSESTRFAVIYYEGSKQSVTSDFIVPNFAILSHKVLETLPIYQKKCTVLDALCQGIESWWSVNSTEESREISKRAVMLIDEHIDDYIFNYNEKASRQIMFASNLAGQAINITQTTAAHAMSYKLTSMYKLPHGHAVAVCLPHIWRYMIDHPENCIDPRGAEYLKGIFKDISNALGEKTPSDAADKFEKLLRKLNIQNPETDKAEDIDILTASVNPTRLKNNPVFLSEEVLKNIYLKAVNLTNN